MKKTISITIGGVLFQIEEDGYEQLRQYLDQVHRYFATYEDSREILSDIETRIAELFISKHPDRQESVTKQDVEGIIATMGSVADFEADEAENDTSGKASQYADTQGATSKTSASNTTTDNQDTDPIVKGLRRNIKLKMLGGVCAGLAQYLSISAVWVRLGFLALFFGFGWLPFIPITILVLYIALWVSMPGVYQDELRTVRKLFRSNKNKAIAGVCGGLAQYFGLDVGVVRLLAIVAFFVFGIGFWIYIILWVVTPLATSLTDEMKMTGTPINLASIENTIKRNLQPGNSEVENNLTKIILLPFRLIGAILTGLAPIAGAILRGIGIVLGLILLTLTLLTIFGLFLVVMAALNIVEWASILHIEDFPVTSVMNSLSDGLLISACVVAIIPLILVFGLALRLVFGRPSIPLFAILILIGLWVMSIGWATVEGINFAYLFSEEGEIVRSYALPLKSKSLDIQMGLSDEDHDWSSIELEVESTVGDSIQIIKTYQSNGKSRTQAESFARQLRHKISLTDSTLTIDGRYQLEPYVPYRGQEVTIKVLVPKGIQFTISKQFTSNLRNINWENYSDSKRLHNGEFRFSGDTLIYQDDRSEDKYTGRAFLNEYGNYNFPDPEGEPEELQ